MEIFSKILIALAFVPATAALGDREGSYEIPAGAYMDTSVTVELGRARIETTTDDLGNAERIRLSYKLPKVIAGPEEPRFDLEGTKALDGPTTLSGNGVVATCAEDETDQWQCTMFYALDKETGLFAIDIDAAAAFVEAQPDISEDRAAELKAASFSLMHEAIGIIRVYEQ